MFENGTGNYRRLNRGSGFPFSRNVTYFVVFLALVVFVALFYLYLSASSELARLRQECNSQSDYVLKLKNELLETNVKVEKLGASETECTTAKETMKTKYESCQEEIGKKTSALEEAERKNGENDGHTSELQKQLQNLTNIIEEQKVNMSAAEKVGIDQQATIINLKETVENLRKGLALKDSLANKQKEMGPLLSGLGGIASSFGVRNKSSTAASNGEPALADNQPAKTAEDGAIPSTTEESNQQSTSTDAPKEIPDVFGDSLPLKPGVRVQMEENKDTRVAADKDAHAPLLQAAEKDAEDLDRKDNADDIKDDGKDDFPNPADTL